MGFNSSATADDDLCRRTGACENSNRELSLFPRRDPAHRRFELDDRSLLREAFSLFDYGGWISVGKCFCLALGWRSYVGRTPRVAYSCSLSRVGGFRINSPVRARWSGRIFAEWWLRLLGIGSNKVWFLSCLIEASSDQSVLSIETISVFSLGALCGMRNANLKTVAENQSSPRANFKTASWNHNWINSQMSFAR